MSREEKYSTELKLNTSKEAVLSVLTDAHVLAGVSGHITLYKIFDKSRNEFVPQADALIPDNKYKAAFIYQDESGTLRVIDGIFEGPKLAPNQIIYEGTSDDNMLKVSFTFTIKNESENGVVVGILAVISYESSFWDRFRGDAFSKKAKWYGNFAEHFVTKHFEFYLKRLGPKINYNLTEISRIEGDVSELIKKISELASMDNVYVVLKGDDFKFVASTKNSELTNAKLKYKGRDYTGPEALSKLLFLQGKGELKAYRLMIDENQIISTLL